MITTVGQLIELLENVPANTRIVFTEESLYDESVYLLSPDDIVYETSLLDEEEGTLNIKVSVVQEECEEEELSNILDEYAVAFHKHLIDSENV